jgi:hypothetical protein
MLPNRHWVTFRPFAHAVGDMDSAMADPAERGGVSAVQAYITAMDKPLHCCPQLLLSGSLGPRAPRAGSFAY